MDITLQRILSLLPTKPDGKIVRGAKKEFAMSIGYESGDIVSQWTNGESTSYKNKLHEIAVKYDVSVEWLKGETDEKKTTRPSADGLSEVQSSAVDFVLSLSEDELVRFIKMGKAAFGNE